MRTAGSPGPNGDVTDRVASSRHRAAPKADASRQDGTTPEAMRRLDHREILHRTDRPDPTRNLAHRRRSGHPRHVPVPEDPPARHGWNAQDIMVESAESS